MKKAFILFLLLSPITLFADFHILILHSYHPSLAWSQELNQGYRDIFQGHSERYLYTEYLDFKRFPYSSNTQSFYEHLKRKYESIDIDLILLSDNYAFDFIKVHGEDLFSPKAVVFCGINNLTPDMLEGLTNWTGVVEAIDHQLIIETALGLHKQGKTIHIVVDRSLTGQNLVEDIVPILPLFEDIEFKWIYADSMEKLTADLSAIPKNDIIYYLLVNQLADGTTFTHIESLQLLRPYMKAPVYGPWSFYLDHGVMGGPLVSGVDQGRSAAEIVLEFLENPHKQIPIVTQPVLNWRWDRAEMERFNIFIRNLPNKGEIINDPSKIFRDNPWLLTTIFLGLGFFISVLTFLTWNISRIGQFNSILETKVNERTKQLEMAQQQLIEMEKLAALGKMMASVSHEINTPLGVGITGITYLKEQIDRLYKHFQGNPGFCKKIMTQFEDMREGAEAVFFNLKKVNEIVKGYKKISFEQQSNEFKEIPVKELLNEFKIVIKPDLRKGEHKLQVHSSEDIHIYSDSGALIQVFTNLVMNSLIHGFQGLKGGIISITCQKEGNEVVFLYKDNGVGIEASDKDQVFQLFYTTKKGHGGSGIGLYIVETIIKGKLGGQLSLHSPSEGFELEIRLPNGA